MTRPEIEPRFPRPLVNTLSTWPMDWPLINNINNNQESIIPECCDKKQQNE